MGYRGISFAKLHESWYIADLAANPDNALADLRKIYKQNDDLRVSPTVFNALREQAEKL